MGREKPTSRLALELREIEGELDLRDALDFHGHVVHTSDRSSGHHGQLRSSSSLMLERVPDETQRF